MTTATPHEANDVLLRPRIVYDALNGKNQMKYQQAALEGRLSQVAEYSFAAPSDRASFASIAGGAMAFIICIIAISFTTTLYLSRHHQSLFELSGGILGIFIVSNLVLGYAMISGHQLLHAAVHRLMGGTPVITQTEQYTLLWSAPAQGFSRQSYLAVLLGSPVIGLVLWCILALLAPNIAALFIVPVVVNMALSGNDIWLSVMASREHAESVVFTPVSDGYIAYTVTAAKVARRQKSREK